MNERACANLGKADELKPRWPQGIVGSIPTARIKKVYGPYLASEGTGRKQVYVRYEDGTGVTYSLAKWLWMEAYGPVPTGYHVHHVNGDPSDDRLENYELLRVGDHVRHHKAPEELYHGTCPECGSSFTKKARNVRSNAKKNRGGPFCSRRCAGLASHR